ncbi:MAG: glucosyltransferase domain-containing protein [Clostridia bacterium]|nr:glucosyltransferase domain-containing protein [Clostridia bacterium]
MNNRTLFRSGADRCAFFFTAVFSLMAHGYRYLSPSFSGDAMLLSQVGEEAYQTSLGRFLQPVYWQIRGYITAPFLIGLFAALFAYLSALLIIRMLGAQKPLHVALICGVLTANETMAISNATYIPWTDVYMLALLLSLAGVYVFRHVRFGFVLSPVLYCLSLGLYQSYLPAAATMLILLFLLEMLDGAAPADVWRRGLLSCVSLVLGLLLYALVLGIILACTGGQASQDYNGVGRVGLVALSEVPALLRDTFLDPLRLLFTDATVMTWHITTVPAALNIALFSLAFALLMRRLCALRPAQIATAVFLLAVLPLGMNFIQFISKGLSNGLTIYAYNLLYLLPLALVMRCGSAERFARLTRLAGSCICVLLAAFLALNIRTSNSMAFKRDLEYSATTAAMARLLDQAERTEGYVPGETPVVLIGMLPSSRISMERPGFEQIARAQGMRYTYGASYETANYWYLQMALGEPVNLVDHDERIRLSSHPLAASLPSFPAEGCCRMIDGYLFIRIN